MAMKNWKDSEWVDIKELTPLKFMPYMAELFQNITGRDLKGLGDFMGWVGIGSYYHWKLSELGKDDLSKRLEGKWVNAEALHTQLVPHRPGGRLLARSTNMWPVKTRLPAMSPQRLFKPITPESRLEH